MGTPSRAETIAVAWAISARCRASAAISATGRRWCLSPADGRYGSAPALLEPGRSGPPHPADPARALEHPDQPGRQVNLTAVDTVPCARRIRVVRVVPALTQ